MNNLKNLFTYYVILASSILVFQSCERKVDDTTSEVIKCSVASPWGECENTEERCYKGNCILENDICGAILAPCADRYNSCVEDTENGGFKCIEGRCSYNNPDGTCRNEEDMCTDSGVCRAKCNETHKDGACSTGFYCLDGTCVDTVLLCSNIINDGLCTEGKTCAKDNSNQEFKCLDSCGKQFPNGACTGTKICEFNKCYYENEICSDDNHNGVCEEGKLCTEEGKCKRECSSLVQNGVCEFDDQVCFEGVCSFKCSPVRIDGICEDIATKCVEGNCKYKCSSTVQDGYCDNSDTICIDGYCKETCSPESLLGVCSDRSKTCSNGSCEYKCSQDYQFGICEEAGKRCSAGVCIEECSHQFPTGSCPQFFTCENETCKEIECGELNLNGPCLSDGERCIQGICLNECSALQPNGWCPQENFVCYNNSCIDSTLQECSLTFKNGICAQSDEECIDGLCLKKDCSSLYPNGRCDGNRICTEVNGDYICERYSCSDDRPLYTGGTPSYQNGGISGSCCQVNEDCKDGFDSRGRFITNICIEDSNTQGPYCLGLQLTSNDNGQDNNDSMLCSAIGGCNGCQKDTDCVDPYATYGTEEEYFCAMLTYYDFEVPIIGKKDINISYCQRVFPNCTRKNGLQGDSCNEDCNDSECASGLHCVKGICTEQCKNDSFCNNGAECLPINYHLPDTDKDLYIDVCILKCENNSECDVLNANYICSGFTYEYQVNPEQTPAPMINYCRDEDTRGNNLKERCNNDYDCKNRICGVDGFCTTTCKDDIDCGNNAYCNYNALQTGKISHLNTPSEDIDLNYLGQCRYLSSTQGVSSTCTKKADCPTELINGKSYQCLPKLDFVKNLPNGKSGDTTYGRCGIIKPAFNKAYSETGESCNNTNQLCESDLCVCGNKLCSNNRIGKCEDYCETSSDCTGDEYCKRILLRESTEYSSSVYTGVCESTNTNTDTEACNIINSTSATICPSGKTCVDNAVNSKPEADNPNKFGAEYICVKKYTDKLPLNQACARDSECNSQLCNPNTNKCSIACTNSSQCEGIGSSQCNLSNILVDDANPSFIVYSGVCE